MFFSFFCDDSFGYRFLGRKKWFLNLTLKWEKKFIEEKVYYNMYQTNTFLENLVLGRERHRLSHLYTIYYGQNIHHNSSLCFGSLQSSIVLFWSKAVHFIHYFPSVINFLAGDVTFLKSFFWVVCNNFCFGDFF